jgi:hypothetical protein
MALALVYSVAETAAGQERQPPASSQPPMSGYGRTLDFQVHDQGHDEA